MRVLRDRHGEIEDLHALLVDECTRDRSVIFAGTNPGKQSGPRQNFLSEIELRFRLHDLKQFVVQTVWFTILNELKRSIIILGRDDYRLTILDFLLQALSLCRANRCDAKCYEQSHNEAPRFHQALGVERKE